MTGVLPLALALMASATPRVLIVAEDAELASAVSAGLMDDQRVHLMAAPTSAACTELDCAIFQARGARAEYAMLVTRSPEGAALLLVEVEREMLLQAKDVSASAPTLLGASLGSAARSLIGGLRPSVVASPKPVPLAPVQVREPPLEAEPDGALGAVGITIGVVLGVAAVGAAGCLGVSVLAGGVDSCADSCTNAVSCGSAIGTCLGDLPQTIDNIAAACGTVIELCGLGLSCLRACNGARAAPETAEGAPELAPAPDQAFSAMAF